MDTKQCSTCRLVQPTTQFNKHRQSGDGLRSYCRACQKKSHKKYYQNNKTRVKSRQKEYKVSNRYLHQARRAKLAGVKVDIITSEQRKQLDTQPCCAWCGILFTEGVKKQLDHIRSTSRGGAHRFDNLIMACFTCNRRKNDNLLYSEWIPPNGLPVIYDRSTMTYSTCHQI